MPDVLPSVSHGPCRAHCLDAREAATSLKADVAYLDPPYNQHSYLGNYHIWESLILGDKPEVYGVACKRVDVRERKSDFNSRRRHLEAFQKTIEALDCPLIVVSFNNEGYQTRDELEALLSERGPVFVVSRDFKRYVGAQIGIYNPSGDRVGDVTHLRNKEFIYLVATETGQRVPGLVERLHQVVNASLDSEPSGVGQPPLHATHQHARVHNTDALRAQIVEHVQAHGTATQAELQSALQLSEYHVRLHLGTLVSLGALRKQGSGRNTSYAPGSSVQPTSLGQDT